jgi:hypothetical protein
MKKVILKIHGCHKQDSDILNKIIGLLDAKGMCNLIDNADLEANPRLAKASKVTDSIRETMETSPELFMFKSKGLLVSSRICKHLERDRFQLEFQEPELEGILDGGHNTLAIASHFISCAMEAENFTAKTWEEVKIKWDEYRDKISAYIENTHDFDNFYVPIEIIYPSKNESDFIEHILEISSARNNNAELTETARGHHSGYYQALADILDPEVESKVEWKTNEPDKPIKAPDVIALSLIPMIVLQNEGRLPEDIQKINPVSIYSGKGLCVKIFNDIVKHPDVSEKKNSGERIKIINPLVNSALLMMKILPKAYDLIYELFPDAYNRHSPGFGRISCVRNYDGKTKGGSYLSRQPITKFYGKKMFYKYPDGFIIPVVCGLTQMMEIDGDKLVWKVEDPLQFIKDNIVDIVSLLVDMVRSSEYNPQTVGKNPGSYKAVGMAVNQSIQTIEMDRMRRAL